ncbi:MAG: hypothetical protein JWN48_4219 [Myxococcaceae bacterium]|nr:hypothetical protein [Myxococcaceae bacterium]
MRQRIASLLSQLPASAGERPVVQATGVVTRTRRDYKLVLTVRSDQAKGTRSLRAEDCTALSETAAWLVAVTVDPDVPEASTTPEPASAPATPPAATAEAAPPAVLEPFVPVPSRSLWSVHAGAFAGPVQDDVKAQTRLQLGGVVGVGRQVLELELRYGFALPRERRVREVRAEASTQSVGLAGCALWGGRLRAGPCASLSTMVTRAEARGLAPPARASTQLWWGAGLGGQAAVEIVRHLELFGEGGLVLAISDRPSFTIGSPETVVLATRELSYYARLGLRYRWALSPRRVP